ncbi:MAG TPA: histidine--tRNA ligase [Gemmatimonadaceae bacterium]|nr:histidine--tRNA ligase [Gemmatimonadaceae bacterium]
MAKGGAGSGLPGFRDFYPEDFAARAHILATWRSVATRFGFVEYDGPPLEPLDLYTKKSGDEIVGQLYNFKDKGDRDVALRPEMTPTFARMVGARANAMRKPIRWFSIPQLFRYERQQKGRLREHFQLNVDIVGEKDVAADAELLAVAVECMRGFGLGPEDVRARVSDRRLLHAVLGALKIGDDRAPQVFAVIDKLDRQPKDISREKLTEAGISADATEQLLGLQALKGVDAIRDTFGAGSDLTERLDELRRYLAYTDALGIGEWVDIDLTIVRGLAYYTGTVFELFDAQGEFRAICGGGRYDTLLASLGGVDLPALGFGMGDVVLGELLKARGKLLPTQPSVQWWVAYEDSAALPKAMEAATRLRRSGLSVEYALRFSALGKQLDAARKAGAAEVVILRADGSMRRKVFASGTEEPFTFPHG